MQFRLSVEAACRRALSVSGIGRQLGFIASDSSGGNTSQCIGGRPQNGPIAGSAQSSSSASWSGSLMIHRGLVFARPKSSNFTVPSPVSASVGRDQREPAASVENLKRLHASELNKPVGIASLPGSKNVTACQLPGESAPTFRAGSQPPFAAGHPADR